MKNQIIALKINPDHINGVKAGTLTKRLGHLSRASNGCTVRFKFDTGDIDAKVTAVLHIAIDDSSAIIQNPASGECEKLVGEQLANLACEVGFADWNDLKQRFPAPFLGSIISWKDAYPFRSGKLTFRT